ncbi:MAG: hypothetical protein HUJ26_24715 [Planctomycetaceae bacterium]|nr:hypothetical protein [Planctomycetaceae bacterium]
MTLIISGLLFVAETSHAASIGLVADNAYKGVTVFDADSNEILGSVPIPRESPYPGITGDCVVAPDQQYGYVSDFQFRVWVIDLQANPPQMASGINPIPIGNNAEDLVMSPDGKFLIACDGGYDQPVVLVDVSSREQISQYDLGGSCNAVDICPDGSILAASAELGQIHRLEIDESGFVPTLVHSGYILNYGANNVYCSPDGQFGVAVRVSGEVITFSTADMLPIDAAYVVGEAGMSGQISRDGTKVFVRSVNLGNLTGYVTVYDLDLTTGLLSNEPSLIFPVGGAPPNVSSGNIYVYFGIDQLALNTDESLVYIPERDRISIYDASTGNSVDEIGNDYLYIHTATGISIQGQAPAQVDIIDVLVDVKPGSDTNSVNLRGKGRLSLSIFGSELFGVSQVDSTSIRVGDPFLSAGVGIVKMSLEDVNGDGIEDLLMMVDLGEMVESHALDSASTMILVTGITTDDIPILGGDVVRIVGKPPK